MCYSCYEDYGKPTIVTDEIRQAAKLIEGVYGYADDGGHLHVALDDWNLNDSSLDFCERRINDLGHVTGEDELAASLACLKALQALSVSHRAAALAIHEGFLKP